MSNTINLDRTHIFIAILVSIGLLSGFGAFHLSPFQNVEGSVMISNLATIFVSLTIILYEFERRKR